MIVASSLQLTAVVSYNCLLPLTFLDFALESLDLDLWSVPHPPTLPLIPMSTKVQIRVQEIKGPQSQSHLGGDIKHSRGRKTRSEEEEDSLIVYQ